MKSSKRNIYAQTYLIKTKIVQEEQSKNKYHFISSAVKTNLNRIVFHSETNLLLRQISFLVSCKYPFSHYMYDIRLLMTILASARWTLLHKTFTINSKEFNLLLQLNCTFIFSNKKHMIKTSVLFILPSTYLANHLKTLFKISNL